MKAINASLSKGGFSRKASRSVVFGSPLYGGLGWRYLYFEQGILHTLSLIKHLRTPGPFHSLLLVSLDWYQRIAGVSFSPFRHPNLPLPYLDHAWFDCTIKFLRHCHAHLEIPSTLLPQPNRQHDKCIMETCIGLELPPKTLKQLNCY